MMCNPLMEDADVRRAVLRELIRRDFNDTPNQFAVAIKKPPGQINDMLANPPRKAFGSRIARQIEIELGLDRLYFENAGNADSARFYAARKMEDPVTVVNETVMGYQTLTAEERDLLNGFRNAPEEVRKHLVNSVREYIKTERSAA